TAELQIGQKGLLVAGVVAVLFGIGYFLKYAFDQNWVGPWGRVAMAYAGAFLFLGVGEWARGRKYDVFGLYLIGGSIATFYLATYSAFQMYHLLDQTLAFLLMVLVTVYAGILSLRDDSLGLALLGLVGGFLSPVMLDIPHQNYIVLLGYAAVLNACVLSLAFFKQWKSLNILGFICTWILFLGWYGNCYTTDKFAGAIAFSSLFFVLYEIIPFAYSLAKEKAKGLSGLTITIPNTFIAFGLSYTMITGFTEREFVSIATGCYALLFLGLAWFLQARGRRDSEPYVLSLAKCIFFSTVTIPILFSQNWVTVFIALLALLYLFLSQKLGQNWLAATGLILLFLSTAKMLLFDFSVTFLFDFDVFHYSRGFQYMWLERWFTLAAVLGSLGAAVKLLDDYRLKALGLQPCHLVPLKALFLLLCFLILNMETVAYFYEYDPASQVAAVSVLWALFAGGLMAAGFIRKKAAYRVLSLALFTLTLLKVFLFDMADMETPYRIISFIALGLLLIGASYLYHKFKDRLLTE
ncbi:MAG TPA: DUF2339 domain-containing protein, partial [bacterium]|nr:DUF2339 domain-containing protein [bacterium]